MPDASMFADLLTGLGPALPVLPAVSPLEMFALPFMWRALVTMVVLAVAAGIIGLFISFRELEFLSDGLVHAVFPGLVIGAAVGGSAGVLPGAAIAAVIAVVLLTVFERRGVGGDAAIAVVLTALFSLGVVLVSRQDGYISQLQELLFGRLLTVTSAQLIQIAVVAVIAVGIVLVTGRAQLLRAFDPVGFEAAGYRVFRTDLALGVAIALLTVAGVQALGVLMVVALLTVPMATARLVTRGFVWLVPLAILVPLAAGVAGLWVSFEWSLGGAAVSPGAVVVLLLVAVYLVAAVVRVVRERVVRGRPAGSPLRRDAGGARTSRAHRAEGRADA